MKKVILLAGGLLLSLTGIAQVTTAYPNSGIPEDAGTNGINNVHIGAFAGSSNYFPNSGVRNVFVGYESGSRNQDGVNNTFLGYQSGKFHSNGSYNVFLGSAVGLNNMGSYNLFGGSSVGLDNQGDNNVFLGHQSGYSNITGGANVFLGYNTGYYNTSGTDNTFLGFGAGKNNENGNRNVSIGSRAGYNNLEGIQNVFLGYLAGYNETGSNKLYISNSDTSNPLVYGEFDTKELKFNANKVGIGPDFGSFPALTGLANADDYRLFVRGGILAEEVRVRLQSDWADYVFSDDYKLPSLKETEAFINENKHLPNMPSAKQVEEEGIEMGNIIKLQQEKIEELTLYLIQQEKEIQKLKEQNSQLEDLKTKVELLLNKD